MMLVEKNKTFPQLCYLDCNPRRTLKSTTAAAVAATVLRTMTTAVRMRLIRGKSNTITGG